eukprot:7460664-Ditylum_brightwellii.AAC.1
MSFSKPSYVPTTPPTTLSLYKGLIFAIQSQPPKDPDAVFTDVHWERSGLLHYGRCLTMKDTYTPILCHPLFTPTLWCKHCLGLTKSAPPRLLMFA